MICKVIEKRKTSITAGHLLKQIMSISMLLKISMLFQCGAKDRTSPFAWESVDAKR